MRDKRDKNILIYLWFILKIFFMKDTMYFWSQLTKSQEAATSEWRSIELFF